MMMAAPATVAVDGTSPNTTRPKITAQMIMEYWYGTTTLAGASFSERLTENSARLERDGVTQPNGDIAAPSRNEPANCDDAITMSGVDRSERVISINPEKLRLPASAISAGPLKVCAEGRSAMMTPRKPIRIAVQRRQPTRSPRTIADSAVTNTGAAR